MMSEINPMQVTPDPSGDGSLWMVVESATGNVLLSGASFERAVEFAAMWDQ